MIHERTFHVRFYECDPYGHVNHANYLRYMQEAAITASAAAGYDQARYEQMGRIWLIREHDISFLQPLVYGDSVVVRTWVGDFERVRSRRLYEMRRAGSGELVAEGATDWVFLDRDTLQPARIPSEIIDAFLEPEDGRGDPRGRPPVPREPFPDAPPPPPGLYKMRRHVEWRDLDPAQHVNNAVYLAYFEDCGIQVAASHGWPLARMMAEGFGIVARRYRVEYREPARMDDELEVATYVSGVRRSSAIRHYTLSRTTDQALLARGWALWVWIDLATGRPRRVPDDFAADFAANIVWDTNEPA